MDSLIALSYQEHLIIKIFGPWLRIHLVGNLWPTVWKSWVLKKEIKIEKTFWNENCLFILRAQSVQNIFERCKIIKGSKIFYRDRFFEAKLMEKYFHLYFKHKIEKTFWNENCLFILRAQSIQFRTYLKDAKFVSKVPICTKKEKNDLKAMPFPWLQGRHK